MARPRSGTDDAVLGVLQDAATPMTAYQVLDALRPHGVQSPPVVYRALDRLARDGRIHRLEALNAYFACHGHHGAAPVVFAVCSACRKVEEWGSGEIDRLLDARAARSGFHVEGRTIELRGLCAACAAERGIGAEAGRPASACGHDHG